jgi:hypothetical protein
MNEGIGELIDNISKEINYGAWRAATRRRAEARQQEPHHDGA